MKRFAAILLTLMLVLGLCASAYATGSIALDKTTEKYPDKHVYKVYQIFTGDRTVEGTTEVLSNVKYGANYKAAGANTGDSVPKAELDAIGTTAAQARAYAATLISGNKLSGDPVATLDTASEFKAQNLDDGYYLIVDELAAGQQLGESDALSAYMVQVLGEETSFKVKKDYPSSDKQITADEHPNTAESKEDPGQNPGISSDNKTDNVSIGDQVTYTITATVPAHAVDYDYYYFIIADTLSDGLSFGADPADSSKILGEITSVKVGSTEMLKLGATGVAADDAEYALYVKPDTDSDSGVQRTFEIALLKANTAKFAGHTITVTYTATLNKDALIAGEGNPNTERVIYSNNPNHTYDGTNDKDKPGKPDSQKDVPTGKTPDVVTRTYTSGIKLQKLDQDKLALKGAKFTISGQSINLVVRNAETFAEDSNGTYYLLKNGSYTTTPAQTKDVMIDAPAGATDGYVVAEASFEGQTIEVDSVKYRVVNQGENPTHILKKANSDLYTSTSTKYKKTTTESVVTTTSNVSQALTVNDDGPLNFKGLGAGTYTITETEAPAGYTKAAPVTVIIKFDNDTKQFKAYLGSESAANEIEADATTNLFTVDVINTKGHPLPETGGMGTKLLAGLGALLMIGTAVLMVSKRRAND